jgi:YidC/Oxa1 family membrane protein insertase
VISNILYFLFIYPVETVIELAYLFAWRVFHDIPPAIVGVSVIVSVLTLPLTDIVDRQQRIERDIQKRMKPAVDTIRAAFRGDERYMMLATYYRQNHYHPVYALRSSLSLIIQIPFFIAAYHFLSYPEKLNGVSFWFIKNFAEPDRGAVIGGIAVNILPLVMTVINCVSAAVHARNFSFREKAQLYGMAVVFLVLLYNSPAGIVLYWTCNNLFSLIKNVVRGNRTAKRIGVIMLELSLCALIVFALFFHPGVLKKRIMFITVAAAIAIFPFVRNRLFELLRTLSRHIAAGELTQAFALSAAQLALLTGVVIPATLIASSIVEFSYIKPLASPLPFVGITALQAAGATFYLALFFVLSPDRTRKALGVFISFLSTAALLNTFVFSGNYGFMLPNLNFAITPSPPPKILAMTNFAALAAIILIIYILFSLKRSRIFISIQVVILIALGVLGTVNVVTIASKFKEAAEQKEEAVYAGTSSILKPEYTFSKTGRNVLVIMLDRGISGFVPYIFEEKPELFSAWSGFTYYPNCISFAPMTFIGAPPIFGGYEYTPLEIQKKTDEKLQKKYNDALYMLPRLLADNGFSVTTSDLPFAAASFNPGDNIRRLCLYDKNFAPSIAQEKNAELIEFYSIIISSLFRFSIFKCAPMILHRYIYDQGNYLSSTPPQSAYPPKTLNNYALLYYLPRLTETTAESGAFANIIVNDLTHEPAFFQAPEYEPVSTVLDKGSGPWANDEHYHVNMAAFLLLGKYFDFLKENGVYDNTRIIVVSDHGRALPESLFNNMKIPNGNNLGYFNPLLLVKDFNANAPLRTNMDFMTNADTPLLATQGIIENPRNPWTGVPLAANKAAGVTITSHLKKWQPKHHNTYTFAIQNNEWFNVKDNIFVPENWSTAP